VSFAKVIEVIAEGDTAEEAVKNAVTEAFKTVNKIRSIDCKHIQAIVEDNKVINYRVNAKITFIVESGL
jgi:flavin-binding protein dodecin